jgi:hypothetical protein
MPNNDSWGNLIKALSEINCSSYSNLAKLKSVRTHFERALEYHFGIPEDRLTKENFVMNANPEMSTQKYEHRTYFKISQKWYGKGKKIRTQFQTGIHQDTIFIYDHDLVYEKTQDHLKTLPCWFNHGYYSSSNNFPLWAKNHVEELA